MSKVVNELWKIAVDSYGELGVDPSVAVELLGKVSLSIHCWQGDDVGGFEAGRGELSGGGIQVTGNYPGKARNVGELRADLEKVYSLIPGRHRLNLHAIYGEFGVRKVDRDCIDTHHFRGWTDWAGEKGIPLDFNGTFFSHPKAAAGFTLSSKDPGIRRFWIEHAKRVREIAAWFGREQGTPSVQNLWIPDGHKDYPVDRTGCRARLKDSLDEIFAVRYPETELLDSVETKLFGIGSEAFVAGSHEFYLCYAMANGIMPCFDLGHFHPTESVADKISSVLLFTERLLLHVSRPMRWDSDHVVILNDDILYLAEEIVRSGRLGDVMIALDFFDATLNRVGAWVSGARAVQKALLIAMLQPKELLAEYENNGDYFGRMALLERLKTMPWGAVWDYFCRVNDVPTEAGVYAEAASYGGKISGERS